MKKTVSSPSLVYNVWVSSWLYDCNNNLSLKVICSIFAFICSSVFVLGGNKSGVTTTEAHLKSSHNLISCLCISYNTISNITIISSTLFFLSTYIILFHSNRNLDSLQLSFGYHKCFQTFLFNCFWLSNYPRFLMWMMQLCIKGVRLSGFNIYWFIFHSKYSYLCTMLWSLWKS